MAKGWGSILRGRAGYRRCLTGWIGIPAKLLQAKTSNNTVNTNLDPHFPVSSLRLTAASSS